MELRKDYFLDRWVIVSRRRGKRPYEFKQEPDVVEEKGCAFCPGHEDETPPEIGRLERDGHWYVRWFANKFAFLAKEGDPTVKTHGLFTFSSAYGEHEVVVETEDHSKQLSDLPVEQIKDILGVYASRIKELEHRNAYVTIFKNHGKAAGTSLVHSHTQIAAVNVLPPNVLEEVHKSHSQGRCLYCEIVGIEKDSDRRVFENASFVAFCPYASRFNFEVWIFAKEHVQRMEELNDAQLSDLAEVLKKILVKLAELNASYNFIVHYAPKDNDLHFHIEVLPRIAKWGGFELSSGMYVNHVLPADAARFYRGEK